MKDHEDNVVRLRPNTGPDLPGSDDPVDKDEVEQVIQVNLRLIEEAASHSRSGVRTPWWAPFGAGVLLGWLLL